MSKFYKSNINIGGKTYTVVQIQHEPKEATTTVKLLDRIHHIHLIDRSGSMEGHIGNLIEQVKLTLRVIPEDDLFSLGWFSSVGEHKFVVKAMSPKDKNLDKLLDELKSTVGCTCFREILCDTQEVIKDTATLCSNFNITLFTDGRPVCDISADEEIKRSVQAVKEMSDKIIAFNTIGYGNNYNQDMLKDMAAQSQYGVATHSLKITEYLDIFKHNYEIINELVSESVTLSAQGAEIVYLNRKFAKLANDTFELKSLDKSKNIFFVIGHDNTNFVYNKTLYNIGGMDCKDISAANVNNLLYALVATKYAKGDRRAAIDIAHVSLKNKRLIDIMIKAFTMDEIELVTRELNQNVVIPSSRSTEIAADNYLPPKNAKTVLDVLGILAATESLYVPDFKNYSAIGIKTKDEFNLFTADAEQKYSPFGDFVFSKEKLNMNLRFFITGKVKLNPKQAVTVGLPKEVPAIKFRNHTIIKDGYLNIPQITALVPQEQYNLVINYVGTNGAPVVDTIKEDFVKVTIDLTAFPLINLNYAEMAKSADKIFDLVTGELELEAKIKTMKHFIKVSDTAPTVPGASYTPEQEDILKQHGVKNGVYNTIAPAQDKTEGAIDYYEARTLEISIKGASSIPSVSDVIKIVEEGKASKSKNPALPVMIDTYRKCKALNVNDINHLLKLAKSNLSELRTTLAAVKLAKIYSGDWFTGLEKGDKGEWIFTKGDTVMLLKAERNMVPFSIPTED